MVARELVGRAIVVTGAGRGLGRSYASALAAAGADVVVNDIDVGEADKVASLIRSGGGSAVASGHDVSDWGQSQALVDLCLNVHGRIDGLVNNAGVLHLAELVTSTEASWRDSFEVNVFGTVFPSRHAVGAMLGQRSGSILNITSGSHAGDRAESAYGASKGAVASLTYSWAAELAGSGVRVNALAPLGATRMVRQVETFWRERSAGGAPSPAYVVPEPQAIGPVVVYLMSDAASHINGQVVRFDGERMSVMTHPSVLVPQVEQSAWTPEAVAEAFEGSLNARLQPLGLQFVGVGAEHRDLDGG
jgi:NAD(P)-dependent dehydrogenase (short-subunit alcohol dehydrogenase family)